MSLKQLETAAPSELECGGSKRAIRGVATRLAVLSGVQKKDDVGRINCISRIELLHMSYHTTEYCNITTRQHLDQAVCPTVSKTEVVVVLLLLVGVVGWCMVAGGGGGAWWWW